MTRQNNAVYPLDTDFVQARGEGDGGRISQKGLTTCAHTQLPTGQSLRLLSPNREPITTTRIFSRLVFIDFCVQEHRRRTTAAMQALQLSSSPSFFFLISLSSFTASSFRSRQFFFSLLPNRPFVTVSQRSIFFKMSTTTAPLTPPPSPGRNEDDRPSYKSTSTLVRSKRPPTSPTSPNRSPFRRSRSNASSTSLSEPTNNSTLSLTQSEPGEDFLGVRPRRSLHNYYNDDGIPGAQPAPRDARETRDISTFLASSQHTETQPQADYQDYVLILSSSVPLTRGLAINKGRPLTSAASCRRSRTPRVTRSPGTSISAPIVVVGFDQSSEEKLKSSYQEFTASGAPRCQGFAVSIGKQCGFSAAACRLHIEANRASRVTSPKEAIPPKAVSELITTTPVTYEPFTRDGRPRCQGSALSRGRQCLFPAANCRYHEHANQVAQHKSAPVSRVTTPAAPSVDRPAPGTRLQKDESGPNHYEPFLQNGVPRCQGYAISQNGQCLFPSATCRFHPQVNRTIRTSSAMFSAPIVVPPVSVPVSIPVAASVPVSRPTRAAFVSAPIVIPTQTQTQTPPSLASKPNRVPTASIVSAPIVVPSVSQALPPAVNRPTRTPASIVSAPIMVVGVNHMPPQKAELQSIYESPMTYGPPRRRQASVDSGLHAMGIHRASQLPGFRPSAPMFNTSASAAPLAPIDFQPLTGDGRRRCQSYTANMARQCLFAAESCRIHDQINFKASVGVSGSKTATRLVVDTTTTGTRFNRRTVLFQGDASPSTYLPLTAYGVPRCQGFAVSQGRQCQLSAASCRFHTQANQQPLPRVEDSKISPFTYDIRPFTKNGMEYI